MPAQRRAPHRDEARRGSVSLHRRDKLTADNKLRAAYTGLFGSAPHLTSPADTHSVLRFEGKRIRQHLCSFSG